MSLEFEKPNNHDYVIYRPPDIATASTLSQSIYGELDARSGERARYEQDIRLAMYDAEHEITARLPYNRLPAIAKDLNRRALRLGASARRWREPVEYDPNLPTLDWRPRAHVLMKACAEIVIFHAQHLSEAK